MPKYQIRFVVVILFLCILFQSCAKNVDIHKCISNESTYGFFGGLWHGMIAPLSLISMIWSDNVVYATNNNGGWYAFGFCLGAGILGFSSSKSTNK
jgi:hypothetical protein